MAVAMSGSPGRRRTSKRRRHQVGRRICNRGMMDFHSPMPRHSNSLPGSSHEHLILTSDLDRPRRMPSPDDAAQRRACLLEEARRTERRMHSRANLDHPRQRAARRHPDAGTNASCAERRADDRSGLVGQRDADPASARTKPGLFPGALSQVAAHPVWERLHAAGGWPTSRLKALAKAASES